MPSELRCQSCETLVPTPDSSAGESVTCPGCGANILVPTADAENTIALKLPSGLSLDHRAGDFGEADAVAGSRSPTTESRNTGSTEDRLSQGIPRLAVVGSDNDAGNEIPLASSSPNAGETSQRRKRDDNTMVPRLPVVEKPDSTDRADLRDETSSDTIQLQQPGEPEFQIGISDSHIDMMTSQENRVWREERAKRQAEEVAQQAIFRFGAMCCALATLVTIAAGLPYVLAASSRKAEPIRQGAASQDQGTTEAAVEVGEDVDPETSDEPASG